MKISPCGWYCFEEPHAWVASDTTESIVLHHPPTGAMMEVTSARKDHKVRSAEIWDLLEQSLDPGDGTAFEETTMSKLPSGPECLRSVVALEGHIRAVSFVFWGHYCLQAKLYANAPLEKTHFILSSYDQLLQSVQALTTD